MEVWIEIKKEGEGIVYSLGSLPLWKCGLKLSMWYHREKGEQVTSLVEVWIEIEIAKKEGEGTVVTSLVEVWIEIILTRMETQQYLCHFPCGSVD